MKLKFRVEEKGGPGSGHRGHSGRPGKIGGSSPGIGTGGVVGDKVRYRSLPDYEYEIVDVQAGGKIYGVKLVGGKKDYFFNFYEGSVFEYLHTDLTRM